MKISIQWLKELIPGLRVSPKKIAARLTEIGFEVEAIHRTDQKYQLELPDHVKVGETFAKHFLREDTILEVAITPNRGDCLSHWGLARELAAGFGLKFIAPKTQNIKGSYSVKDYVKLYVKDSRACIRYCLRVIRGIHVAPSPLWLARRLELLGIRSINNVVDATNYVMLETGHPLHAFDHRLIQGGKIVVRRAGENQKFLTLDGQEKELVSSDLVIADAFAPIALAGIMGGQHSQISDDTSTLVCEAASFNAKLIRQTARRLALQTESSHRFERFVPPETVALAIDRLAGLICTLAGGILSRDRFDHFPSKRKTLKKLFLRSERIPKVLGLSLPSAEIERILNSLCLKSKKTKTGWSVEIPSYRSDLEREIDLMEEIIRLHGFDKVPSSLPTIGIRVSEESQETIIEDEIKSFLMQEGFCETIHYSFENPDELTKLGYPIDTLTFLKNPMSRTLSVMRPTLLLGLLSAHRRNQNLLGGCGRYFELRSVYSKMEAERKKVAGLYAGDQFGPNWQALKRPMDFFYGKGLIESLCKRGRIQKIEFIAEPESLLFHPGQLAAVFHNGVRLGFLGQLHPALMVQFEIKEKLYFFELDTSLLVATWLKEPVVFKPISSYPHIQRDLALVCDNTLSYQQILAGIQNACVPWLTKISLFDSYEGDKIPQGKKSLALTLIYENQERTLTDEEVNQVHFQLVNALKQKMGLELR